MTEEPVSDDDDDFHDAEPAPPECGNGPTPDKSNGTTTEPTSDIYSLAVSILFSLNEVHSLLNVQKVTFVVAFRSIIAYR